MANPCSRWQHWTTAATRCPPKLTGPRRMTPNPTTTTEVRQGGSKTNAHSASRRVRRRSACCMRTADCTERMRPALLVPVGIQRRRRRTSHPDGVFVAFGLAAVEGQCPTRLHRLGELRPRVHRGRVGVPELGRQLQQEALHRIELKLEPSEHRVEGHRQLAPAESGGHQRGALGQVSRTEFQPDRYAAQLPFVELESRRELGPIVYVRANAGPTKPCCQTPWLGAVPARLAHHAISEERSPPGKERAAEEGRDPCRHRAS